MRRHKPHETLKTGILTEAYRVMPFSVGDWPVVMTLRKRSLTSMTRRHVMVSGSMSSRTNLHDMVAGACHFRQTATYTIACQS